MALALALPLGVAMPLFAQYPGQVKKKDQAKETPPLRSLVVVEWTGDLAKPKASRVVPITVWDGSQLQDGGVYLARPNPLALDYGVEYVLEQNGDRTGFYEIQEAAKQQSGWIGFGKWKAIPKGPTPEELARQRAAMRVDADEDYSDKPVLHRKQHDDEKGGSGGEKAPPPDSDRPTLKPGGDTKDSSESGGTSDPDRPTLKRGGNASDGSGSEAKAGPAPDPDRPRLSSKSEDTDRPKMQTSLPASADMGPVSSVPSSGDPDRPTLKRGVPEGYGKEVTPTLVGLPPEMKQEVGISDARTMKPHSWEFSWSNPDDPRTMKESLEEQARKLLSPPDTADPAPAPKLKRPSTASAKRKAAAKPTPEPPTQVALIDPQFRVFELSYGGGATMVYTAHTDGSNPGENGVQRFVTIVAQPDLYGSVVTILKSVTDAAHLDVKPRMKLVDAVDAEGDNRGELLFELRGQNQREFALYRVVRGQATQVFLTGPSYFGVAGE